MRNLISQNSIYQNTNIGIDLGNDAAVTSNDGVVSSGSANNGMDYPIVTTAMFSGGALSLKGFVGSSAVGNTAFANASIEVFKADDDGNNNGAVISGDGLSKPHGEGKTYLGNIVADGSGLFDTSLATTGVVVGDAITMTATDPNGNTSEFSSNVIIINPSDYSDAPATYGSPSHIISSLYLGAGVPDTEAAAQPSTGADGDDTNGTDDEDGVVLPSFEQGKTVSISVNVVGAGGKLQAWIDWNADGDFNDSGEQIATNLSDGGAGDTNTAANVISFAFTVPPTASTNPTYARFRWSSTSNLDATTAANEGEVEDYALTIKSPPTPFTSCPAETFITLGSSASTINLYALDLNAGALNLLGSNAVLQDSVNAIGFRQQDGYLWGWNNKAGSIGLMRIGANGIADMPYGNTLPTGLTVYTNPTIYRGDVSPSGIYTMMHLGSRELWNLDVTTNTVVSGPIVLSSKIGTDLAYHPTDGFLYAVSDVNNEVQRINPTTGAVTGLGLILPTATPGWGAMMFDNKGILYAYNGNTGEVYRVFNVNGTGTLTFDRLVTSLTATNLDGARCVNAPPQAGAAVLVSATTVGGTAGSFDFKLVNAAQITGSVSTTAAATPAKVDGDSTVTGSQPFSIPATHLSQDLTIEEITLPSNWRLSAATCSLNGSTVGALSGNIYTLPASAVAAGNLLECNFSHVEILRDYSDAAATYGTPNHELSAGLYLGAAMPDADSAAFPSAGADGDDSTGSDDEDGVTLPTEFTPSQMVAVSVKVAGSGGKLQAWIDWNGDGDFLDAGEQIAKNAADNAGVDTNVMAGVITFNVTPPAAAVAGSTYARFRWSTQSNLNATAAANDGEVEDYAVTIAGNTSTLAISGRVYQDKNVNALDNNEAGLKDVVVVLHDLAGNTCKSMKTAANGSYQFDGLAAGDYTVYEAVGAKLPKPSVCPPAANDPNGYISSTANQLPVTLTTISVAGVNFGDVHTPSFSLDNSKVILPNSTITYPHLFQAYTDGNVLFSIDSEQADPANLHWGTTLFLDNNCDSQLDQGDTELSTALAVNAGTKLCILAKVTAPANASAGALHVLNIKSDFQYGDASLITASHVQIHTDRTQTSAGTNTEEPTKLISGEGKLSLVKSVWNVTRNIDGATALPGETLRYTIHYENIGNGLLNELAIQDSVPEFTQLIPASLFCGVTPPELTACSPQANGNSLEWVFTGKLKAGSKGEVSYQVKIE